MHFAFIPYGIKNWVDFFLEDLNHRYLPIRIYKEGEEDKYMPIQCQVRIMPFGIVEFVFPKEYINEVLSAFNIDKKGEYFNRLNKKVLGINPMSLLRKVLKLEPIPEFTKIIHPNLPMPDYSQFVAIIPIGIREDGEFTEKEGKLKGWKHEAI